MNKVLCCLIIILFCSFFGACRSNNTRSETRDIIDMKGRTVAVPQNINKLFMDWGSGVTLLMTLGAIEKLAVGSIALDGQYMSWTRLICPDLALIPRDQAPFNNLEALLIYEPDVVITMESNSFKISDYERIGLPVVFVTFSDYTSFKQSMTVIGNVLGGEYTANASKFNDFFDSNISLVSQRLQNTEKKVVYYLDSRAFSVFYTVGRGEIQETWINMAGGNFATYDLTGRNQEISREKFLSINPDIILIGSQEQAASWQMLMNDAALSNLKAVGNQQVYRIPQGLFPWCKIGPESSMQMIWAAKILHPDIFYDIDIEKMLKDFYLAFYGTEVSDENIAKILKGWLTPAGD